MQFSDDQLISFSAEDRKAIRTEGVEWDAEVEVATSRTIYTVTASYECMDGYTGSARGRGETPAKALAQLNQFADLQCANRSSSVRRYWNTTVYP